MEVYAMEILFETPEGRCCQARWQKMPRRSGGRYRAEVPEDQLYSVLDELRRCEARILSVTPLRPTLEDYFLKLVAREKRRHRNS